MTKNHGLALENTVFDYDLWNESSLKSKCKEVLDNGVSWERLCQKVYVYYHLQKEYHMKENGVHKYRILRYTA